MRVFRYFWLRVKKQVFQEQREQDQQEKQLRKALERFDSVAKSILKKGYHV